MHRLLYEIKLRPCERSAAIHLAATSSRMRPGGQIPIQDNIVPGEIQQRTKLGSDPRASWPQAGR
jgi:hypothetical protein